jgi:hypothetical protein
MARIHRQFAHRHYARREIRQIIAGNNSLHPRHGQGCRRINGFNPGVGMRAADDLAVQQTGQINIRTIFGAASDFIDTVVPNWAGSDNFKFCLLLRHYLPPLHDRSSI